MTDAPLPLRTILISIVSMALMCVLLTIVQQKPAEPSNPSAEALPADGTPSRPAAPQGIVYLAGSGQTLDLSLADRDGKNARTLMSNVVAFDTQPGGAEVVYSKQDGTVPSRLEIIEVASGITRTLIADPESFSTHPAWSPADGVIAYERRSVTERGTGAPKVWLIAPDGTSLGPMFKGADMITYGAKWSPDGARIVALDATRSELVLFNFSAVSRSIPLAGDFDWSPDGAHIVVAPRREDTPEAAGKLFLYDVAQERQVELAAAPGADDSTPRWSPDGAWIAFIRRVEGQRGGSLWMVPVQAGQQAGEARPLFPNDASMDLDPQWSPDGTQLMWTRFSSGPGEQRATLWQVSLQEQPLTPRMIVEDGRDGRWIK